MDLSVIIVSYNVRAFLEKCLISVYKSLDGIDAEVIVVDNNSIDDTVNIIEHRYPSVRLIKNKENLGFSKANNIGIRESSGRYLLILNPDTVVSEDTFRKCIEFMDATPDAGSVGVKMYDGTGTYLPESKRGLPSPLSSFFKITGINRIFPRSGFFNKYYEGGLDPDEIHRVDVLTGAFMFMRRSVLEDVGLLDEDFFMYGEDIDLSYRILQKGFYNYYLPTTSIIHYKGESTKRSSITYVRVFYKAMLIFVRKHYPGIKGVFLRTVLYAGILIRAVFSGLRRLLELIFIPLADLLVIVSSVLLVTNLWAVNYFGDAQHFDDNYYKINLPVYSFIWFLSLFLFAGNRVGRRVKNIVIAVVAGTVLVLILYSLLAISLRSSRAVILLSAPVLIIALSLWTAILNSIVTGRRKSIVGVVGSDEESEYIMELINRVNPGAQIAGVISVDNDSSIHEHIGEIGQLHKIVAEYNITELIFSHKDISFSEINKSMTQTGPDVMYKIAGRDSDKLVGSHSKYLSGGFYTTEVRYGIADTIQRRNKRLLDCTTSALVLLFSPVLLIFKKGRATIGQAWDVLVGKLTWVTYDLRDSRVDELPPLRPGVFAITRNNSSPDQSDREVHMLNYLYAREYTVWRDLERLVVTNTS